MNQNRLNSAATPIDQPRGRLLDPQRVLQEIERLELGRVPDHGQPGGDPEQGDQDHLRALARPLKLSLSGLPRGLARLLHRLEDRALLQLQPHPQRHRQQHDREEEGNPPAPGFPARLVDEPFGDQHDRDRLSRKPPITPGLDEAGVEAALVLRRMLGDVDRGAAIFAAQREPLQHAQQDEQDRRGDADRGIARHQPDRGGGEAHQGDGDEKGIFAPQFVAEHAEQDRADRTDAEADAERRERQQELGGLVAGREELLADDGGERAVDEEIVPFEDRAERRGEDHQPVALDVDHIIHRHRLGHNSLPGFAASLGGEAWREQGRRARRADPRRSRGETRPQWSGLLLTSRAQRR